MAHLEKYVITLATSWESQAMNHDTIYWVYGGHPWPHGSTNRISLGRDKNTRRFRHRPQ